MTRIPMMLSITAVTLSAAVAAGDVPDYDTFTLRARSNLCVNTGGDPVFHLPCDTFFNSETPDINDNNSVAVALGIIASNDTEGIFLCNADGSGVVYTSTLGAAVSGNSINNAGDVVFEQLFSSENGLWIYDASAGSASRETTAPLGASGWSSPRLNESGQIGYRANFGSGRAWISYDNGSTAVHAADSNVDIDSDYSFLFTPSFNNARQIAGKLRVGPGTGGDRPDEIRIFNADGSSVLIAEDADSNAASPYSGFDNSVSLTNTGWVAFNANLVAGGRGVFISDGTTTHTIATEADPDVSDIEFFGPDANDNGLVAFRGKDGAGLQAIFVGDGTTLRRMIGEHDLVETDLGTGRIDQHDGSVVFGGGVSINAHGAVVFNAALTPENNNQIEWGSGIVVSGILGDLDGNLIVNIFDLLVLLKAWNTDGPGADIAPPFDVVDVFDLVALLKAWTP